MFSFGEYGPTITLPQEEKDLTHKTRTMDVAMKHTFKIGKRKRNRFAG